MKITDFIPQGADNAIPMNHLAALLGLPPREVRRAVFRARRAGFPICSSTDDTSGGYYFPDSPDEAAPYIREQQSRIKSAQIAIRAVERFIERESGTL